ncbi:sensor histidine kinase [Neobacillus niacini]|uniref:sensor histidine kinase n=1 Tax=Neobacillus niacini TaxID=86668 RepID=UPI00300071E8
MSSIKNIIHSLRFKLFMGMFIIIVPLVLILFVNNYYAIEVVRNQVAQSNNNLLNLYMKEIDRNLMDVDKYLSDLSQQNMDLLELEYDEHDRQYFYTKAKMRLYNQISEDIGYYKSVDMFFVYSSVNKELIMTPSLEKSFEGREAEKETILRILQEDKEEFYSQNWYVHRGERHNYLFHLIRTGGVTVGAWVNANKLMVPLNLIDLGKSGAALLVTKDMQPLSRGELVEQKNIHLNPDASSHYLTGSENEYLVIMEPSSRGDFSLVALIPNKSILERLPELNAVIGILGALACGFLMVFLFYMRKVFLLPINQIVYMIKKLRAGEWNKPLNEKGQSSEFDIMQQTFNQMIKEIQDLKINVYEEKLNHQKAELKHLQLQINPHFFLNSLNIIYNLATIKEYKIIQEMSKCLVNYFRFMFRSSSGFVSLKDELAHTENYVRIQQLRFPDSLTYRVQVPDELNNYQVPPLMIQTLVENAIKHAVNLDELIDISITIKESVSSSGAEHVSIRIQDNGQGFPEDVLTKLQREESLMSEEGERIGIWNLNRRLQLLYHGQASVSFQNLIDKGAVLDIFLPVQKKGESTHVPAINSR